MKIDTPRSLAVCARAGLFMSLAMMSATISACSGEEETGAGVASPLVSRALLTCPASAPLVNDGQCVSVCPPERVEAAGVCTSFCPPSLPTQAGGSCVAACAPGSWQYTDASVTVPACETTNIGRIEAESVTQQQGVTLTSQVVSFVDHGDWVRYGCLDFGPTPTSLKFFARVATPHAGNDVVVRLDSVSGPEVARLTLQATGCNFSDAQILQVTTQPIFGVHDLFLVFDGAKNRKACQDLCWNAKLPGCDEAVANGCGYGVGNFDFIGFASTSCMASEPYLSGNGCTSECGAGLARSGAACTTPPAFSQTQCVASCPAEAPFSSNTQCLAACPVYVDGTTCVDACASGLRVGTQCVAQCPAEAPWLQGDECVAVCASGARVGATCVLTCPPEAPVVGADGVCRAMVGSANFAPIAPVAAYQPVTISVQALAEGQPTNAGTVTFYLDGVDAGSFALAGSFAAMQIPSAYLTAGDHAVTAVYSGATGITGAQTSTVFNVGRAATHLSLAATPNPVAYGALIMVDSVIDVQAGSVPPTNIASSVLLNDAHYTCTLDGAPIDCQTFSDSGPGVHVYAKTFVGSADYLPVTAAVTYTRLAQ